MLVSTSEKEMIEMRKLKKLIELLLDYSNV